MYKYKQFLSSKIPLSDSDWKSFSQLYSLQTYQKGEMIIPSGNVCIDSYYLASGVARSYFINENFSEITCAIHIHNTSDRHNIVLGDMKSILSSEISETYCVALSLCHVYTAKLEKIHQLFEDNIAWANFVKTATQERLVQTLQYQQTFAGLNAKQRYLTLKEQYPLYEEVLTSYQLASVLGITPQSLSRIRTQLQS